MCDCIKRLEKSALKNLPLKELEGVKLETAEFQNKAFYLDSNKGVDLTIPMIIRWKHKTKKGKVMEKKKEIFFVTHYCPFCGEKRES